MNRIWYVSNGEVTRGFDTPSCSSLETLLANPQWDGEFHQVKWCWFYSEHLTNGDNYAEGSLVLRFRKPARGRRIDISKVRGTLLYGNDTNHGNVFGMRKSNSKDFDSEVDHWVFKVEWAGNDNAYGLGWNFSLFLGAHKDEDGHPFIQGGIGSDFGGDIFVLGKRDTGDLTQEESDLLGLEMTGREYRRYADAKWGGEHYYERTEEDEDESGSESEEEEGNEEEEEEEEGMDEE